MALGCLPENLQLSFPCALLGRVHKSGLQRRSPGSEGRCGEVWAALPPAVSPALQGALASFIRTWGLQPRSRGLSCSPVLFGEQAERRRQAGILRSAHRVPPVGFSPRVKEGSGLHLHPALHTRSYFSWPLTKASLALPKKLSVESGLPAVSATFFSFPQTCSVIREWGSS